MSTIKGGGKEKVSTLDKFVNHESLGNFVSNFVLDLEILHHHMQVKTRWCHFVKSETKKTVKSLTNCFRPMNGCTTFSNNPWNSC